METTLNLESKEKLDNNSIEKLLKKYLTAVNSIAVKQINNVSADNGTTYIAKIVADCDSKVLLSQLYTISRILDRLQNRNYYKQCSPGQVSCLHCIIAIIGLYYRN